MTAPRPYRTWKRRRRRDKVLQAVEQRLGKELEAVLVRDERRQERREGAHD